MAENLDDLLQPTLQDHTPDSTKAKPWHPGHQFWIAFLGGVLAITGIAYLNSKRLGQDVGKQRLILITGALGLVVVIALVLFTPASTTAQVSSQMVRLEQRIVAVLAYALMYQIQKPAFRPYSYTNSENYASLWKPGIIAILALGIVQAVIVLGLYLLVRGVQ
jgi:hypothetical protein